MSEANDLTEMLELMCMQKPSDAKRSRDGECLEKRMDIGAPGNDARTNRDAARSMSGDESATVRRERTRMR